jgi:hypothetical protein
MRLQISTMLVGLAVASCGGDTDDSTGDLGDGVGNGGTAGTTGAGGTGGSGGLARMSDEELDAAITDAIDALNSCSVVEDCSPVAFPGCGTTFIGPGDSSALDPLFAEYNRRSGDIACTAECRCGLLSCTAGRCETRSGDCMTTGPGEVQVCL